MSATPQTVDLPAGVRHYQTSAFAESWDAYDALKVDDGWEPKASNDEEPARWKEIEINGHRIVVHEPLGSAVVH